MSLPILLNQQLIDIPLSWNELTLAQYTRMYSATQSSNDYLAPIAALLQIDKHTLQSLPEDKLTALVLNNLLWLNTPPLKTTAEHCPKYLQLGDDLHTVPQNFDGLKFGQVLLFQSVLSEHTDKETGTLNPAAYARLLAIVFSAKDEPINDSSIDQLEAQLQQIPFTEAMPVLNFFELLAAVKQRERKALSRDSTPEEKQAGIKRFEKFGAYPLVRMVMQAENLTYDQTLNLPYHRAFVCLWYENEKSKYRDALMKFTVGSS
ncbi:MAG: hypothetical protein M0D57_21210 [Sphingobacteriales bacterium JAD_PAG50586_3]|nr:MAG: hypothetical protein M0D57_21210 [Sphingobacteriales bacterium JAD_PAG50586_3]